MPSNNEKEIRESRQERQKKLYKMEWKETKYMSRKKQKEKV